jgi:glycyl-tRNA synthetase beta chain
MADFLVEIGTEELPPKALMNLANAFHDHIISGFRNNTFGFGKTKVFATPRRIAVLLENLDNKHPVKKSLSGDLLRKLHLMQQVNQPRLA